MDSEPEIKGEIKTILRTIWEKQQPLKGLQELAKHIKHAGDGYLDAADLYRFFKGRLRSELIKSIEKRESEELYKEFPAIIKEKAAGSLSSFVVGMCKLFFVETG